MAALRAIDDTRVILNSLQTWKVNHVRNEVNGVVHRLVKKVFFFRYQQVYMEEVSWYS